MNTNAGSSPSPNTEISTPSMGTVSMAGQIQLLRRELAQAQAELAVRTEELTVITRALLISETVRADHLSELHPDSRPHDPHEGACVCAWEARAEIAVGVGDYDEAAVLEYL